MAVLCIHLGVKVGHRNSVNRDLDMLRVRRESAFILPIQLLIVKVTLLLNPLDQ